MSLELEQADSGTSRRVQIGDRTTVRLPESPTTGYRWQAEYDDASLRLLDDRSEAASSPRGAGGDRVLVFEALRVGAARLHLSNRRSWGTDAPIGEFVVDLDVLPPG